MVMTRLGNVQKKISKWLMDINQRMWTKNYRLLYTYPRKVWFKRLTIQSITKDIEQLQGILV